MDGLGEDDIKEVLETSVDMNNNESLHASVVALRGAKVKEVDATDTTPAVIWTGDIDDDSDDLDPSDNKVTVKYIAVKDNLGNFPNEVSFTYLIPVTAQFKTV